VCSLPRGTAISRGRSPSPSSPVEVAGADTYYWPDWVAEMGSQSATPICSMTERLEAFREHFDQPFNCKRSPTSMKLLLVTP
jgi:hypothetical protein